MLMNTTINTTPTKLKSPKTFVLKIFVFVVTSVFHTFSFGDNHISGFAFDSSGHVILDGFGNCVRTGSTSQQKKVSGNCLDHSAQPSQEVSEKYIKEKDDDIDNQTKNTDQPDEEKIEISRYNPFKTEVKFNFDKYIITKTAQSTLDDFITRTKKISFRMINLLGHADALGANNYNIQLSIMRAKSVANYLINNGISGNQIAITGLGESDPVADNNTREGRAENRRVLIELE